LESRDILQMALNISGNSKEEYLYHVLVSSSSVFPDILILTRRIRKTSIGFSRLASVILMSMLYLSF